MKWLFYCLSIFLLFSCNDFDYGWTSQKIFSKEYQENFEKEYGKIPEGHTWGFIESSNLTRAELQGSAQYKITKQFCNDDNFVNNYKAEKQVGEDKLSERLYARHNCPPEVTQEERDYVFNYLQENPNQGNTQVELNNYFIQDLGRNIHTYITLKDQNGQTREVINDHMNYLFFDDVHLNDYNSPSVEFNNLRPTYYVTNTQIINPSYSDSENSSSRMTDHYRFYYIPPKGDFKGGCYLCFDYATDSQNGKVLGDGIFDDWVVKVTPGEGETNFIVYRVFCEDLGSTYDLDFNDLVFDYIDMGSSIALHVLALEGTLPISIDGIPQKVDSKGNEDLIPHHNVDKPILYLKKSSIFDVNIIVSIESRGDCFIYNTQGRAPYLIRVLQGIDWPQENQRIEEKYPRFYDYVIDPWSNPFWWEN